MVEVETSMAENAPAELSLDPFSFFPGVASSIVGLGGSAPGADATYAFHTPYVEVARGPAHFRLRFEGLSAKRGTLTVRVHMLPMEDGAHARLASAERILLSRLVVLGGQTDIRFEGFRGVTYAVMGLIADSTDAEARGLSITLDRPAPAGTTARRSLAEAWTTAFGHDVAKPAAHLVSLAPPTLAKPVSQMCTSSQLIEAAFAKWGGELPGSSASPLERWQHVYAAQVLDQYGMLAPGARGVGFDRAAENVRAAMTARGAEISIVDLDGGPDGASDAGDPVPSAACNADPHDLLEDLVNFDFAWSVGLIERFGNGRALARFIQDAMECLRPGGLAVHVLRYKPGHLETPSFVPAASRSELERLALTLISRGHEVAQMKVDPGGAVLQAPIDGDPESATTFFGLIVRKAVSAL